MATVTFVCSRKPGRLHEYIHYDVLLPQRIARLQIFDSCDERGTRGNQFSTKQYVYNNRKDRLSKGKKKNDVRYCIKSCGSYRSNQFYVKIYLGAFIKFLGEFRSRFVLQILLFVTLPFSFINLVHVLLYHSWSQTPP